MEKFVIILGPTAVGKSDVGIQLAKKFNGEIISADSVQIYQGLDIGSAKILSNEMNGIVHHCIDILPPQSEFSVYEFVELTKQKISEISQKGKLPFVVGGTGLYIKALLEGYDFGGVGKQNEFRKNLQEKAKQNLQALYNELVLKNCEMAGKIKPTDEKRIIRALEIIEFGSLPQKEKLDYEALVINLQMDRNELYERINKRTDIMFENGLIEEVERLLKLGCSEDSQSMRAIGYKEVISYLKGDYDLKTTIELVKQHSRNYAKRQMTFFRSLQNTYNVDVEPKKLCLEKIENIIKEWL